jgi:threonine/homoserine/homoserine lactone efflux protein
VSGIHHLALFLGSCFLLTITPGQDTLYILGRTVSQGRRAGLLSVLGICCGLVVHSLAAALGLSAVLATSSSAFTAVKLAGAAYLVYLGVMMWRQPPPSHATVPARRPAGAPQIFWAGLLTNLLNPKVALFFLAFLPQFVDPAAPSKFAALLLLGGLFIAIGAAWSLGLVLCAAAASGRLRADSSAARIGRRTTGALFMGLGVKLALGK